MTKQKSTKRALLLSALSLLMCVSMLIGSTFAWFTDSVTSAGNKIQSGTLDVVLEYSTDGGNTWEDAENKTLNFKTADNRTDILWEPGCTYELPLLRVRNNGNLALKYQIAITGVVGDAKLLEAIDFTTKVGAEEATSLYSFNGVLNKNGDVSENILISGHMREDAGNEYQGLMADGIAITVFATQQTYEADSFDYTYDANSAVKTIDEAEALMAKNEAVLLLGCKEPDGILNIPVSFTNTLTIVNSELKSVQAEKDANIIVIGDVTINAKGAASATAIAEEKAFDGSAISVNGKLNLSGNGSLTAIAADTNGASGIGGMKASDITIKDVTIERAEGSYAYQVGTDTKYYKNAPEGGAAIGSGYNGANITLDNVTVIKAIGGSKAAGIGARYHAGTNVTIKDSIIHYVEGGVSAAGIGGSRVSQGASEDGVTINIANSNINAVGGAYGAGIGSGYDTHCQSKQPMCAINITDSIIKAIGGKYAAGVGTGYHNAALFGEIKNSTVTAVSGEKIYKDTYTPAMDIGFGVVDPAREGQQTDSQIIYNGVVITLADAPAVVSDSATLTAAVAAGKTNLYLQDGEYDVAGCEGKSLTLSGSKKTVIRIVGSGGGEGGGQLDYGFDGSNVTFNGVTIKSNNQTYAGYARMNGVYNNCTIENTYCLNGPAEFYNCVLNVSGDQYSIWTWGAPTATFKNCTFNSDGKAILLYGTANTKLTIDGCTFNDSGVLPDLKAAIEIGNDYGKSFELIVNNTTVNGYEINDKGISTGTTLWGNKNSMSTDKLNVVIDGVDVY